MDNTIVIVCACDDKYAGYCGVMITSIFENNKNNSVEVNILTDGISEINIKLFHNLENTYKQRINIVNIDNTFFAHLPIGKKFSNYISLCTYYRLLIPTLFKVPRILYLDCDVIVRGDLKELWETDIEGFAFGAIKDIIYMIDNCTKRLNYPKEESYYNAGISLYNLDFLRDFGFDSKVKDFIENDYNKIVYHDQDILNGIFHGYYKDISLKWNFMEQFLKCDPQVVSENREEVEAWCQNPSIIHYASTLKPWFLECKHIYKDEFWKYVKISPWNNIVPIRKYKTRKEYYRHLLIKFMLCVRDFNQIGKYRFRDLDLKK